MHAYIYSCIYTVATATLRPPELARLSLSLFPSLYLSLFPSLYLSLCVSLSYIHTHTLAFTLLRKSPLSFQVIVCTCGTAGAIGALFDKDESFPPLAGGKGKAEERKKAEGKVKVKGKGEEKGEEKAKEWRR